MLAPWWARHAAEFSGHLKNLLSIFHIKKDALITYFLILPPLAQDL